MVWFGILVLMNLDEINSSGGSVRNFISGTSSSNVLNSTLDWKASTIRISLFDLEIFEKWGRFNFGSGVNNIFESSYLFHLMMTEIDQGFTFWVSFSGFMEEDFKIDLSFFTPKGSKYGDLDQGLRWGSQWESSSFTILTKEL